MLTPPHIVTFIMYNSSICFWMQGPLDRLSLHLQATQEACLWDTTVHISPVPSPCTCRLEVSTPSSTNLENILHHNFLLQ